MLEWDYQKADEVIAEKAVEQLRADDKLGHILMARAGTIKRAEEIYWKIYMAYQREFNPVRIHTGLNATERERIREEIISGKSRIIVCVDMFGEGFDLPELKIAAFHDIRKSLPVTLQLAGRFTRAKSNLGQATFIANVADVEVREELQKLYAQNADWNTLLRQASTVEIEKEFDLWEFIEGFGDFPKEIPLQNFQVAMSTVVYKTKCKNWDPDNFKKGLWGVGRLDRIITGKNTPENTRVIVTTKKINVNWAKMEEIFTWDWELYVLYWDKKQNLLFIHCSSNRGIYKNLAKAVAGDDVELIRGEQVLRCLSGFNRLKLQNVGLLDRFGRMARYTMTAGSDVEATLTEAQKLTKVRSNIFGAGFEGRGRLTIGCSRKGRIWSWKTGNILELTSWCSAVGRKLLDENLVTDDILSGTLIPVLVSERPEKMPIDIEWPEKIYKESETAFWFTIGTDTDIPLYLTDICLIDPQETGDLQFQIQSENITAKFSLKINEENGSKCFSITNVDSFNVEIKYGNNQKPLVDFFVEHPPLIWFADGSSIEGNSYIELKKKFRAYPIKKIKTWDWNNITIKKESQRVFDEMTNTTIKAADSIQYRVIEELKKKAIYDIIFDDDDSGESADVVTIKIEKKKRKRRVIKVEFYHCKYSSEKFEGSRIEDLYEVCGQAQKSIHWMERPNELFAHLLRREARLVKAKEVSRFEAGDKNLLWEIKNMSAKLNVELSIFIVQPGVSVEKIKKRLHHKTNSSRDLLQLLSVTENYLMETYKIPFGALLSS